MITVKIQYTDGHTEEGPVEEWKSMTAEGVDWFDIGTEEFGYTHFEGRSLYWVRRESDTWVVGAASVGFDASWPPEIILSSEGEMVSERDFEYFPDIYHSEVKLGWWR